MYGLAVVPLVYHALCYHTGRYSWFSHSPYELFWSELGELYRYVQKVYEMLFTADYCTW